VRLLTALVGALKERRTSGISVIAAQVPAAMKLVLPT